MEPARGGGGGPVMTREQRLKWWLAGLAVFLGVLYLLNDMLLPFVAGMAVAYFLDPVADRLERWGCSRTVATSLITLAFFAAVIALLVILFPLLQRQVVGFASRVPGYVDALRELAAPVLERVQATLSEKDIQGLQAAAKTYAGDAVRWFSNLLQGIWGGGVALFNMLSLLIITPVVSFYLLRDWDTVTAKVDSWLPLKAAPAIREQLSAIDQTIAGFVRGQACVCLILAAFYAVGLSLAGLEFGLLVGMGAGVISFVPYLGAAVGLCIGVGIAFAQFAEWTPIVLVAAVFFVGQTAESYVLTPRLVGGRVGLHPVWIIFALLAGGAVFGFTGVLLAIPVAAVIGVLLRFGLGRYLESPLYKGGGAP